MTGRQLRVLIAPDSFKGSLTSVQVARALADGWHRARPGDDLHLAPLADGGEGTLVAIEAAGGWQWREADATDPLGRPIRARWLRRDDGRAAVVEMAEASGLSLVAAPERDAARATSEGTGDMLRAVLDEGIRDIALGIGGSATTDGGAGLLRSLGAAVSDDLSTVDLGGLDPRLPETRLRIACDVTNPLLGPTGAAAVYGPQKGASPSEVHGAATCAARGSPTPWSARPVAGSATRRGPGRPAASGSRCSTLRGPVRGARAAARGGPRHGGGRLRPRPGGVPQLVITGEGRIDAQTAYGKTALGVAKRAHAAGKPCIAVGGGVTPEGVVAMQAVGAISGAGRRDAADRRGGDGRGDRAGRALWRAARAPVRRGDRVAGGDAAPLVIAAQGTVEDLAIVTVDPLIGPDDVETIW